jgi:hypothetical protein
MKRIAILLAVLAFVLTACGQQVSDEPTATLTPEAAEPTSEAPTPSEEPAETDDGGGATGSLDDVIPDELNGVAATAIPGLDQIIGNALAQQGLSAEEAEVAFVTYGEGEDAVVLQAFRIPGVTQVTMQQLASVMAAGGAEGTETLDIGGKTVVSFTNSATPGVVYFYVADDTAFTVAGQNEDLVEQLLSELP